MVTTLVRNKIVKEVLKAVTQDQWSEEWLLVEAIKQVDYRQLTCFEACLLMKYIQEHALSYQINVDLVIDILYGAENIYDIEALYKKYGAEYEIEMLPIEKELATWR